MKTDVGRKTGKNRCRGCFFQVILFFLLVITFSVSGVVGEKVDTQLSVSVLPDAPPEGVSFTVTGTLTDINNNPLGNKRVSLESSPDGNPGFPFERVATVPTDQSGRYEFFRGNHTPAEYIRVQYQGNANYNGSVSKVIPVHNAGASESNTNPSRTTGGLMLTGDPDKALVMLDGELIGVTPFVMNGIETGPHILEIGKPGYQNQTMEVFIAPMQQTSFSFSLPPAGIHLANAGIQSATGLNVYSNTSFGDDEFTPLGDPVYSLSRAGVSVDIYGNETTGNETGSHQITTLYDEHPFGDGFSLSVIITDRDTPYR